MPRLVIRSKDFASAVVHMQNRARNNGSGSRLGVKRRAPSVEMSRSRVGTFVRSRNRTCHCRQRNEPEAGDPRHFVTTAFVEICSFGG